jgi:hypothetical protein
MYGIRVFEDGKEVEVIKIVVEDCGTPDIVKLVVYVTPRLTFTLLLLLHPLF